MGLSITAEEVMRFKQSAIKFVRQSEVGDSSQSDFVQWVGDNVDHNLITLTGKETFYGMGIIAIRKSLHEAVSPQLSERIPRLSQRQSALLDGDFGVKILPYSKSAKQLQKSLIISSLEEVNDVLPSSHSLLTILWHTGWFFSTPDRPRPNWSGYMQSSTSYFAEMFGTSTVEFLPLIDLNPNSQSCIFSTLTFIIGQANNQQINTPCVTFDQPLWLKAMAIIKEEQLSIICRLGGFHVLMSFLGSIGNLMKGSGIEEAFEQVYAPNSVVHMMTGKKIARAIRAHILVYSALMSLLLKEINDQDNFSNFKTFYEKVLNKNLEKNDLDELFVSDAFSTLSTKLQDLKDTLSGKSRTSKLFVEYMRYIEVVIDFIAAERTSNWELHLGTVSRMLNLFAATGHNNYAKSARLYLQEMLKLPETHPVIYHFFKNGQHTVQRFKTTRTSIWTDLCIEQTLMRFIKSRGGLTRGGGMSENTRNTWVGSSNHSAKVHSAIAELTGTETSSSGEHVELGTSRRKIDFTDSQKVYRWFTQRNPFAIESSDLHSLSTGLVSVKGMDDVCC